MTSKILRFILDLSRAMGDRRKNRGRGNNKKLNILRTKKVFQMTQKAFFITLQGLSFCEKRKIAEKRSLATIIKVTINTRYLHKVDKKSTKKKQMVVEK